mmetsp:Transcript_1835/g.3906  ORF Transcript_1835/g.3906 Transcript_1835/m.3906 type:complete len:301 (-) Transcript_1835:925-1827(-)
MFGIFSKRVEGISARSSGEGKRKTLTEYLLLFIALWLITATMVGFFLLWEISSVVPSLSALWSHDLPSRFRSIATSEAGVKIWQPFLFFLAQQVSRLYVTDDSGNVYRLWGDMSQDMEFTFLTSRFASHPLKEPQDDEKVIVDVGAHDCVTASNSFNFLHSLQWKGVLVEPYHPNFARCAKLYYKWEAVKLFQVAAGTENGDVRLSKLDHASTQIKEGTQFKNPLEVVEVKKMDILAILEEAQVPKSFGVLSVDIEVDPSPIVNRALKAGYKPRCAPTFCLFVVLCSVAPHSTAPMSLDT